MSPARKLCEGHPRLAVSEPTSRRSQDVTTVQATTRLNRPVIPPVAENSYLCEETCHDQRCRKLQYDTFHLSISNQKIIDVEAHPLNKSHVRNNSQCHATSLPSNENFFCVEMLSAFFLVAELDN